ncbi:MAG: peptidase T [Paludibacteraceae bacterium]|nr:peptidase T [Paludibacteraceae bacterium]MBQ2520755.1 peptidase T [Paludibacteraceae bacterium]
MDIVERFLKYVSFCTTSDENTGMTPSTPGQMEFARYLADELKSIGLAEVTLDENGYVMATLPATAEGHPVIGFIAHMDTSPDASGRHIKPSIVKAEERDYIDARYAGQDVIVTDTTTLLGADDKAGIAEIVTAMEYLIAHPEIKHGKVRIGFTPDEEIGQGADHFDVKAFGADFAYTMDGGAIGELEYENFNAAACKIKVHGLNVHPGSAYHKMRNSMRIAYQLAVMLPRFQTPEHTQGYEGFYHLIGMNGTVEETTLSYIIRDHDRTQFEYRKRELEHLVRKINTEFGEGTAEIEIRDQYYNMREQIEPVMHIIDLAKEAMTAVGVTPVVKPIRGGTDGARLSFEGLPCPNIFAGGENFHSRYEYLPIPSLEKAEEVILQIIQMAK